MINNIARFANLPQVKKIGNLTEVKVPASQPLRQPRQVAHQVPLHTLEFVLEKKFDGYFGTNHVEVISGATLSLLLLLTLLTFASEVPTQQNATSKPLPAKSATSASDRSGTTRRENLPPSSPSVATASSSCGAEGRERTTSRAEEMSLHLVGKKKRVHCSQVQSLS